jgi:hypothetical protein
MIDFPILSLVFLAVGAAFYGAIVFWAGTRRLLWLALLVTLPAAIGGVIYLFTPVETPPQAPFLFRHFGWAVLCQLVFGALVYLAGRWKARGESSQKDPLA